MIAQREDRKKMGLRRWLTVDLVISKDFNEPVSNFLMEQGATGIEEITEGPEKTRLKAYYEEGRKERQTLQSLHRYLSSVQAIHPETFSYHVETTTTPEKDWGEAWKQYFRPVRVTPGIVVRPPWAAGVSKKGRISVEINPGVAFGTGTHATTKLCIQALEQRLRRRGLSVLDLGTGSGILSIIAAKLGAEEVLGVDPDGASVENARENVGRNHVSTLVKIREGTIGNVHKRFDIVVANIGFKVLWRSRWPLIRHLKSRGLLVLSGLLEEEKERIRQRYLETGVLDKVGLTQIEEWVCLTFKRKSGNQEIRESGGQGTRTAVNRRLGSQETLQMSTLCEHRRTE